MRRDFHLVKRLDSDSMLSNLEVFSQEEKVFAVNGGAKRKISGLLLNDVKSRRLISMMKQNEKVAVALNILSSVKKYMRRIDDDLRCFEDLLEASDSFESVGAEPGSEVALRPDCYNESEWILGRVVKFYKDTGMRLSWPLRSLYVQMFTLSSTTDEI